MSSDLADSLKDIDLPEKVNITIPRKKNRSFMPKLATGLVLGSVATLALSNKKAKKKLEEIIAGLAGSLRQPKLAPAPVMTGKKYGKHSSKKSRGKNQSSKRQLKIQK